MPRAPRTVSACPILRPQRAPWPWRKRRRSTSRSATKPAPSRSWRRRSRPIRPASKLGWPKPKSTSPPVNTTKPSPPASRPSRCARRTSTSTPRCPASGWSGAIRPRPSITAPRPASSVGATSSRNRKVSNPANSESEGVGVGMVFDRQENKGSCLPRPQPLSLPLVFHLSHPCDTLTRAKGGTMTRLRGRDGVGP